MSRTILWTTAIAVVLATHPDGSASAACNATVNGQPMPEDVCALATRVYGGVAPGHYWLDDRGNWGRIGSAYAEGNLLQDARRGNGHGGGRSWTYRGIGGNAGGDGACTYYMDPDTGASVMAGEC